MRNLYLINASIVLEDTLLHNGFIHIVNEKIERIGEMDVCPSTTVSDKVMDCEGKQFVMPGMIDIHVHGAAGFDFMDEDEKALEAIAATLAKEGTTSFLATTITNPITETRDSLNRLGNYMTSHNGTGTAEMLGIHLEGPFINVEQKGAQPESAIIPPNAKLFKEWQELTNDGIKVITYAPELDVNDELLVACKQTKTIASMGHTNASYDESIGAIEQGVTHATHLFNGMKGMHHRDPGVVGAALLSDEVHVEIIPDGIHFHPDLLKMIVQMKGLRNVLAITDGMRAKGMPDGAYDLGGQQVKVANGKCVLSTGSLAGSIVTMNQARLNLARWLHLSIHEQLQITSTNQANRLGVADRKGSLAEGKDADIVVIGKDGEVDVTICRGTIAYERSDSFS